MKKVIALGMVCLFILSSIVFSEDNPIESNIESLLTKEMVNYSLPGITFAYVQNGKLVYSGALGQADIEKGSLMDVEDTVIQTGAISKVLTSMALLELLKDRDITVDTPISNYLPSYLSQRIELNELTFEDVLAHTTGFTSHKLDTAVKENPITSVKNSFSSEAYGFFSAFEFKPVVERNSYVLFSNINNFLAGVLVESLSGTGYENYMATRFLSTLGMNDSARLLLNQPLGSLSLLKNYNVSGGKRTLLTPFRAKFLPSDDFLTTTSDMVRLMAYLTGDDISRELYEGLFTKKRSNNAYGVGRSYGLSSLNYGSFEIYIQDGGIPGTNARMIVIPEKQSALFFAFNSNRLDAKDGIMEKVLNYYFDVDQPEMSLKPYDHSRLNTFTGLFSPLNASNQSVEKLTQLIHQIRVTTDGKHLIIDKNTYIPVTETVFYNESLNTFATYLTNEEGKFEALTVGSNVYKRAAFNQSFLMATTLLILTSMVNAMALLVFLMKWSALKYNRIHSTPRAIILIQTITMSIILLFILLVSMRYDIWDIVYGSNSYLKIIRINGYLNALTVIPSVIMLNRVRNDFRWPQIGLNVFRVQWVLDVALLFWCFQFNLM